MAVLGAVKGNIIFFGGNVWGVEDIKKNSGHLKCQNFSVCPTIEPEESTLAIEVRLF
jgi:hypothetical protein